MSQPTPVTFPNRGHVFWLLGLSGAGKSTLARQLAVDLRAAGRPVLELDGDRLRAGLCRGLGFSEEERAENLRRAAEVAQLGVDSGLVVVAAFITPLAVNRVEIARIIARDALSFVFVDAPLDVCRHRDVKQLYAAAARGDVAKFTGVTARFEPAADAALHLQSARETVDESAARLRDFAQRTLAARAS
jgi:adenylyl-sulfate kinase